MECKKCADFDQDSAPFAFYTSISTFTFGNEVEHIPACLCYYISGLTSVTIPNSVTTIGDQAFSNCSGLISVSIPNSVTSIGDSAFYYCSGLSSVTIPNSVTSIGNNAFGGTHIPTPIYNENVFAYMPVGYEGGYAVPDGIKSVAGGAFRSCIGLTSVSIPNSVTYIGDHAFYETQIPTPIYNENVFAYMPERYNGGYAVPDGIKSVAGCAFYGCIDLTSVTIPNSVTSIGKGAFFRCN